MNTPLDRQALENFAGEDGLLFACVLDGEGGARMAGWDEVKAWKNGDGPLWLHLDRTAPRVQEWLRTESGMTQVTAEAMMAEETRPRTFRGVRGAIAILRGVNTNPGARKFDMVAIRMWSDGERVITIRDLKLMTPRDILVAMVVERIGPKSVSELFERLIGRLTERIGAVIGEFEENLDDIEQAMNEIEPSEARRRLSAVRSDAVTLRRYMAPQRVAISTLHQEPPDWMEDGSRLRLRETANNLMQFIEDLDEARERAIVIDDGVSNRMAEVMNQNMYVLSIIAAIFLPLGFITGLLGINVGGMPGVDDDMAFWITSGLIGVLMVGELALFRYLKWI